jgi:hypothetical protein
MPVPRTIRATEEADHAWLVRVLEARTISARQLLLNSPEGIPRSNRAKCDWDGRLFVNMSGVYRLPILALGMTTDAPTSATTDPRMRPGGVRHRRTERTQFRTASRHPLTAISSPRTSWSTTRASPTSPTHAHRGRGFFHRSGLIPSGRGQPPADGRLGEVRQDGDRPADPERPGDSSRLRDPRSPDLLIGRRSHPRGPSW